MKWQLTSKNQFPIIYLISDLREIPMIKRSEQDETYEYIKQLTLELVKTPSLVRTETENDGAKKIYEIISRLPYFAEHSENLMLVPLEHDSLLRNCVFAYVQGSSTKSNTVILLSHYDTVDIDGYGELADFAFDPLVLKEKMKHLKFNREVEKDLKSYIITNPKKQETSINRKK